METAELVHQSESDPRALVSARASALHAVKALEQIRQRIGWNAGTGVAYAELDVIARLSDRKSTRLNSSH